MKNISLLPFLNNRAGFYLDFLAGGGTTDASGGEVYPFRILDDSDPVARLLQADLCAGSGEVLKSLFVLMQKDNYLVARDSLSATANPDVEEAWRKAVEFYRAAGNRGGAATLAGMHGAGAGQTGAFQPLLLCGRKKMFFHPVCPRCGLPLELCADDERLAAAGLAPFSQSVTRCLSCDSESCSGHSEFYVHERLPGEPPRVKDWRDLIREYSNQADSADDRLGFPCGGCADRPECFGSGRPGRVLERIMPFSFYPFHMLVFDAMTMDVLHFTALLSGAGRAQVIRRLRTEQMHGQAEWLEQHKRPEERRFLFGADDPRFFSEVIYLKLSLLSEIMRVVPDECFPPELGFRLAPDRIWVKVPEQNSLLPTLWTFTVHPLDIFRSFAGSREASKLVARPDPYFLALIWFSVLAANEHRGAAEIAREIRGSIINDALTPDFPSGSAEEQGWSPVSFLPSDVLWNQSGEQAMTPCEAYAGYWENAMSLGKSLLVAAIEDDRGWSRAGFLEKIDTLRAEIHSELLAPASGIARTVETVRVDDGAIRVVLDDIIAGWRRKTEEGQAPAAAVLQKAGPSLPVEEIEEEESLETIIIGPEDAGPATGPAPTPAADELAETVIIASGGPTEEPVTSPSPAKPEEEELEQTLIIGAGRNTPSSQAATGQKPDEPAPARADEMEETVIISSAGAANLITPPIQNKGLGEDLLEETVIISRRTDTTAAPPPEPPKKEPAKPVEDDLEATLIITKPKAGPGEKS